MKLGAGVGRKPIQAQIRSRMKAELGDWILVLKTFSKATSKRYRARTDSPRLTADMYTVNHQEIS